MAHPVKALAATSEHLDSLPSGRRTDSQGLLYGTHVPTHAYAMKEEEPRETGRTGRIQDRPWGWA